jgi:FKBP-type peptidyl-prolyl cis-trans isomerase FklB
MAAALVASQAGAAGKAALKTQKDKNSYAIGIDIGGSLKKQPFEVDAALVAKGLKDAMSGGKTLMTDQEVKETLMALQQELMAKQQARMKEVGEKNKKEGEAFLAANKTKEGVKTLPSGLQYKVITEGKGKSPKATDMVTVNYRGTLLDGTEFDSSFKRGEPLTRGANTWIKAWNEALLLMKEGSKWQLFVPSDLAYGERGGGALIGPNAALIFEVELLSIKSEK